VDKLIGRIFMQATKFFVALLFIEAVLLLCAFAPLREIYLTQRRKGAKKKDSDST